MEIHSSENKCYSMNQATKFLIRFTRSMHSGSVFPSCRDRSFLLAREKLHCSPVLRFIDNARRVESSITIHDNSACGTMSSTILLLNAPLCKASQSNYTKLLIIIRSRHPAGSFPELLHDMAIQRSLGMVNGTLIVFISLMNVSIGLDEVLHTSKLLVHCCPHQDGLTALCNRLNRTAFYEKEFDKG